ncbi:3-hydroxyacyl-ACP dehydratase FabZ [Hydrogeniiclostridium mannosilyticum]|uniref:3-hydroxyacyl-ACP dehydratase FabZ n=1 Tax=Hydrogeniiclostridium mannosilyticum TaxID=2764322 RepID=UPI0018AB3FF4|nr:3-hydroxyacyl-ACP dehydratase FabZ [Hydrogeniiclostridium mannosilyticum]
MNREELKNILPHREPMLLVDDAEIIGADEAIGHYTVKGDEWFLQGHFPGNPVVPGIVLCEMIGQASCVLLADAVKGKTPYFTGLDKVKFRHTVHPDDCLEIKCKLVGSRHHFYFVQGKANVDGKVAVSAEMSFTLMDAQP